MCVGGGGGEGGLLIIGSSPTATELKHLLVTEEEEEEEGGGQQRTSLSLESPVVVEPPSAPRSPNERGLIGSNWTNECGIGVIKCIGPVICCD